MIEDDFFSAPPTLTQLDRSAYDTDPGPLPHSLPHEPTSESTVLDPLCSPGVATAPLSPPSPAIHPDEPTHSPVPGLLARHTVSLLAGAPSSGRTRFLLPQLENYAAGLPFMGIPCPTPPEQLGMILCGTGPESVRRRIDQLGLDHLSDPAVFPIVKWTGAVKDPDEYGFDFPESFTLERAYRQLTDLADGRPPKFLIIDAIQMVSSRGRASDYHAVNILYDALESWCQHHNCTILATVVTAKARKDSGYASVREGIFGSVAWASRAHTTVTIEECKIGDSFRKVNVTSKSYFGAFPPLFVTFGEYGRLVPCENPEMARTAALDFLDQQLTLADDDTDFTRADFIDWAATAEISSRTVDRWISSRTEAGLLVKGGTKQRTTYAKTGRR